MKFKGNILTEKERKYRLKNLIKEIKECMVDIQMIPYLQRINKFEFLVTTQSCTGHKEDPKEGRKAHIDFRCKLDEGDTIKKILMPLDKKRKDPDIAYQLMIEPYGVRYCLWLDNEKWQEQLEDFITILQKYDRKQKIISGEITDSRTRWKRILGWQKGDVVKVWCGLGYLKDHSLFYLDGKQRSCFLIEFLNPRYCSKVFDEKVLKEPKPWEKRHAKEEAKKLGIKGLH